MSVAHASAENARYLIHPERITASLRENAIDDTVSHNLTTACDLVCRGGETCLQGPNIGSVPDIFRGRPVSVVSHGLTNRTTYVGSKAATSDLCAAISNLQSELQSIHVKYVASLEMDRAKRGPCGQINFSNYPWFGSGTAAKQATTEQLGIPQEACIEKAHMDRNFPFQGATRGELTLTLRYPVGKWASCFSDMPLRSKAECANEAVPVGGSRTVGATIVY